MDSPAQTHFAGMLFALSIKEAYCTPEHVNCQALPWPLFFYAAIGTSAGSALCHVTSKRDEFYSATAINTVLCRLFGGARLEKITGKDANITFDDIAGIDQVKSEIVELVQFLKNPKRFLDLGARSPAGVLLVGPPGTGMVS